MLIGAAWAIVAVRPPRGVLIAAALAGLAFEIKLFQAVVAFPALAVLAWCTVRTDRKRILGRATAVFVTVAAAWAVIASLVPGSHPWPIGSSNGHLWNVILVFNGLFRLNTVPSISSTLPRPSPWRLFTPGFIEIIGFYLLVILAAAVPILWVADARTIRSPSRPRYGSRVASCSSASRAACDSGTSSRSLPR